MNDTQILNDLLWHFKEGVRIRNPLSVHGMERWVELIERWRGERRKPLTEGSEYEALVQWSPEMGRAAVRAGYETTEVADHGDWVELKVEPKVVNTKGAPKTNLDWVARPLFQHYWRCEHHPIAIDNFFEARGSCVHGCSTDAYYP